MSTANPQRLGRYIVTRRLGVGGMAEVFLARSRGAEGVDKSLVVKRILPDFAENPHFRTMFVDEARVALRLNHPNLVQVYGFESDGVTLLLIMEHVDGPDLGLLLATAQRARERVPYAVAALILRELARALHYAHERLDDQGRALEIVHRDVSPANILLSYEGAVKLGDFGIAHARSASFLETGLVQGKYGYMAPEQARGEAVDRRADIFALGVVLLEMLLGRPWFAEVPDAQTLLAQVREGLLPDVDLLVPDAPDALRAVVRRAMRPDRDERYATARDLSLALNPFLHAAEQQADAVTLEQFLERVVPRRRVNPSPPPLGSPSSRPPPPLESLPTVGPGSLMPAEPGGVGRTMSALDPYASVTLPELMLMSDVAAPPRPRVDAVAAVRERVNVAVIVGKLSRPASSPETRALVSLVDALAFKAAATLEWNGDDRFTLLVGVLRPQVDDPLRAARLALDLLDAARTLAADLESVDEALVELAPTLGLGLARGLVACAFDPDGVPLRFEPVDDTLPVANGLATAARPGEALLGAALARFVRRAFVLREASSRSATGGRVWALERLRGRSERDASAEVQGYALLGRDGPMGALRDAYAAVIYTEGGAARRVVGELGVGKSTLLGAFAEGLLSGDTATRVLRVEASLGTSRVPFALIAQLLQQVLVLQRDGDPLLPSDLADRAVLGRALDRAVERWGAGTLGRRAAVRALRSALGLDVHDEATEAAITRELALVLRPMLSETAKDGPLVLLLDGLELADPPSRALAADLARRPPGSPVLVVLALRDDDTLQAELGGVPEIDVGPLDPEARRKLIAQSLGADQASDALVQEVSAVVGGNPLAVLEVVEALSERDRVRARVQPDGAGGIVADLVTDDRGEALLPGTLDEVLAARIDALPPPSRLLLRWCALCEAELRRALVDALGGADGPKVRARLVADGILVESPGADGEPVLAFAHAALRRILRGAVDPTALPAMHARMAEVLERQEVPPGATARHQTALAVHREAAGATRPAARAWTEVALAVAGAGARGQREAATAFKRALALSAGARDVEGLRLQAMAHEGLEEAARGGGQNRARRRELLALREVAVASQDAGVIARALTRQARFKIEVTPGLDTARDVVAAVRAARRAGDARTEAEARWAWAVHLAHRGELRPAIEQADAALVALRREAEVPRALEVEVLVTRSSMRRWTGDHGAALEVGAEALATATKHGPRWTLGVAYDAVGMACMASGGPSEAMRFFRASIALERESGARDRLARTVLHAGKAWGALGRSARALQYIQRAVSLSASVRHGFGGTLAESLVTLAEQLVERGDVDDAAAAIERARAVLGSTGGRYAYVRLCLGDGRVLMARRQFRLARIATESAEAAALEAGIAVEVLRARADTALAAAYMGDRAASLAWMEKVFEDPRMARPGEMHRGSRVLRACAEALRVLGDARGGDHERAEALAAQAGALERAVMATWRVSTREGAKA